MDRYQRRYLRHQRAKKDLLSGEAKLLKVSKLKLEIFFLNLVWHRQSQRLFNDKKINAKQLNYIKHCISQTPSSCNRQAIKVKIVKKIEEKEKLEELLVGGAGWISNASAIFLLFADMDAYKSPAEVEFMPYLDAGFIGMNVYYACESSGIGCCFVNPNVRQENEVK